MIERKVEVDGFSYGREIIGDHWQMFFGEASCQQDKLRNLYSDYEFRFLRQVHGDSLVASTPEAVEADGHYTDDKRIALVIKTADCLPIMIGTNKSVYAIHCGWRGIENQLLIKCSQLIQSKRESDPMAYIGPHIQAKDFEVGIDVAQKLVHVFQSVAPESPLPILPHEDPNKRRINLAQIAAAQLKSVLGNGLQIQISRESTFALPQYHSFRRGKATDARQYSFIVKT